MSFASPLWFAGLALIPIALALLLLSRRRRQRYAVRFPAVSTLALVASVAPSWRRRIPVGLLLLAAAMLVVALARPHLGYRVAVAQASTMLVTDHSGSMASADVQPSRLAAAVDAANTFIDQLPSAVRVGVVAFSSSADAVQPPVTNHAAARAIIDTQTAGGATATGDALALALQLLHAGNRNHPPAAIVLLSDGSANAGTDVGAVARQAGQAKIPIYTVALGTPGGTLSNPDPLGPPLSVPPDPQLMQAIAHISGGRAFDAQSASQLSSIYRRLGRQLGSINRTREVTWIFAAAGLVLLLGAAAGSARWAGRLP
jgi:Ca-activated chloride channel family protein